VRVIWSSPEKRGLPECGNPMGSAGLVSRFWKCFHMRGTPRTLGCPHPPDLKTAQWTQQYHRFLRPALRGKPGSKLLYIDQIAFHDRLIDGVVRSPNPTFREAGLGPWLGDFLLLQSHNPLLIGMIDLEQDMLKPHGFSANSDSI
jgi:hypothetical protein